jgi:uncharacterized protein YggU (UPF0235/DUF167 family)
MAARLPVKVVPGASTSKIAGWLGQELKVRVSAPPEQGKTKQKVVHVLAKHIRPRSTSKSSKAMRLHIK